MTCGTGTQQRSHTCTNPPPSNGGDGCTGGETDTRDCATNPCPGRYTFKECLLYTFTSNQYLCPTLYDISFH